MFQKGITCVYIYQKYENLHMLLFPQPSPRHTGKLQTGWVVSAVVRIQVMGHAQRVVITVFYSGCQSLTNGSPSVENSIGSSLTRFIDEKADGKGDTSETERPGQAGRVGEQELDEV